MNNEKLNIDDCLQFIANTVLKVDYIIEEGTKNGWDYRVWKSGIAECWMRWQGDIKHYAITQLGDTTYYDYVGYWDLPLTFPNLYTKTATAQVGSGTTIVESGALNDDTTRVCLHWLANNPNTNCTVNMYVIGKVGGGTA